MHPIPMQRLARIVITLMIISLSGTWLILHSIIRSKRPKYETLLFFVPTDKTTAPHIFTVAYVYENIKHKRKIRITLDEDNYANQKKLSIIRYEAQKLKYTMDTSTVVYVIFTEHCEYNAFLQLLRICKEDRHDRFAPVSNGFIIWGGYPRPSEPIKRSEMIYL